jgi:hypothetical protein
MKKFDHDADLYKRIADLTNELASTTATLKILIKNCEVVIEARPFAQSAVDAAERVLLPVRS